MIYADPKNPEKPQKYNCIICMLNTPNKKDYQRHLLTVKHKKRENMMKSEHLPMNADNFTPNTELVFICKCGKHYKHNRSLWYHQKTCNYQEPVCVEIKKPREETGDLVAILMERLDKKDKQMMELLAEKDKQNKQQVELLAEKDKKTQMVMNG
jgi:hypothetical protein